MKNQICVGIFSILIFASLVSCGPKSMVGAASPSVETSATGDSGEIVINSDSGTIVEGEAQASMGSICSYDWGIGLAGIYSTLGEFQALVQAKVNSGALTHCMAVSGEILPITAPKGLFGPCIYAYSQKFAQPSQWSSCASQIQ